MSRNEIIDQPRCASQIMAETLLVTPMEARSLLKALISNGYIVAPREPTNTMFSAYMEALHSPPRSHRTMVENVGKARRRWKKMGEAGCKVTMSLEGFQV